MSQEGTVPSKAKGKLLALEASSFHIGRTQGTKRWRANRRNKKGRIRVQTGELGRTFCSRNRMMESLSPAGHFCTAVQKLSHDEQQQQPRQR